MWNIRIKFGGLSFRVEDMLRIKGLLIIKICLIQRKPGSVGTRLLQKMCLKSGNQYGQQKKHA